MDATFAQTSFLGGEISLWAQGDFTRPDYKMSMAKSLNGYPTDEGTWVRRPGFQFLGTTRNGLPGRLIPFIFAEATPYNLEFTDSTLRMWNGTQLVETNDDQVISSISNASPGVFTLSSAVSWQTGDQVVFFFPSDPSAAVTGAILLNRQFNITMTSTTTFTITDSVTGAAISGSTINTLTPTVSHLLKITTPYTEAGDDWHSVRSVQSYSLAMLLHTSVAPQALEIMTPPTASAFAVFDFAPAEFQDGPYLDPPPSSIATPSGLSGSVNFTVGYAAWSSTVSYGIGTYVTYAGQDYISLTNLNINNAPNSSPTKWKHLSQGAMVSTNGFVATDVGRMIRFFSAPADYVAATTYAEGDTVTYNGEYFTSLAASNTGNQPDISVSKWVLNPSAALWTWGLISVVISPNMVTVQIEGAPLLYTTPCPKWRLGAWSDTTGWPTCGCYQEGRFWYGGAIPNRFDTSQSNDAFNMAPTAQDGTVSDSNAISYTLNADSSNPIFWMEPDDQGILLGTQEAEWIATSGTTGTPMTPSNIQAHRKTKYGCANILPVKAGLSICFVQRYARRLLELLVDVFSGRLYGPDLTRYARHLGKRVFAELAYQQELVPIVWGRMQDGSLTGITYRRISQFSTQPPEFMGWHQHSLGSGRVIESICVGPANDINFVGSVDALAMVTNDQTTDIRYVESSTTLMDEEDPLYQAYFLDCACAPPAATISGTNVIFSGLHHLDGRTVSVFAAAIDCGDYVVTDGQVSVPLGTVDSITGYTFDVAQFNIVTQYASQFTDHSVTITGTTNYTIPCIIGFNYKSQGQLCRPELPADTGARNGPGFAKKKKINRYGINLVNSLGVQIGTDPNFVKLRPIKMTSPGGNSLPYLSMYTGIARDSLEGDMSFDAQICWQTTRPYPAVVVTLGGFINTSDNT